MRERFKRELNRLNDELIVMGSMCEDAISKTIAILKTDDSDTDLYDQVAALEEATDKKEKEIESLCLKLIFSEQPVASDLRFISAVLKMISDLERIGDQALDIAELAKEIDDHQSFRHTALFQMAEHIALMVKESVESFVLKDLTLAEGVMNRDNEVDKIFLEIKDEMIHMITADEGKGELIVDVLMIAKYLERIGDHSTNIAEWVKFAYKG